MTRAALAAGLVSLAVVAACLGGCDIPAFFAAQLGPEEKIPAQFEPPEGKTILVLVEDLDKPINYEPVKADLTKMLNRQLVEHEVAAQTIPYARIGELATRSPEEFNNLYVTELGARLGADMVLYVNIDDFGLRDPDASEELWKGRLQTSVRLVDVTEGRLWPKDRREGHTVDKAQTPTITDNSPTRAEIISKELAAITADRIAKLFYDHSQPYEGAYGDKTRRVVP